MSQDPHSGYNPNPEHPYGTPLPQNPYETPSQPPYGVPPSQNPYQVPPGTSYGAPGQPPYGVPPGYNPNQSGSGQPPYGVPPGYNPNQSGPGQPPYDVPPSYSPNQSGYGYEASAPLPLSEAIGQLPNQYIKVLTKPSAFTFATEMGKASWDIVWIQLIAFAIITAFLGYMRTLIPGALFMYNTPNSESAMSYSILQTIILSSSTIAQIIIIPVSFFIGQGIIYLLAKAFGGTGTFLSQGYTYLLISVPLGIISSALGLIPVLGTVAAIGLGIYGIVLQIFSLMAVHRLSGGKATAVVLIPIAILIVLAIIVGIVIALALVAAIHRSY